MRPLLLAILPGAIALAALLTTDLAGQTPSHPGQVKWGSQRYIEYIVGNAPLILTMPHGGHLKPPGVFPV